MRFDASQTTLRGEADWPGLVDGKFTAGENGCSRVSQLLQDGDVVSLPIGALTR
jgi:hypothetical protein